MFFVLSNELYPFFFKNSDMQFYDKMTGIFIGTRKCRCMHVQGGINAVTVQIKATAFGHAPVSYTHLTLPTIYSV